MNTLLFTKKQKVERPPKTSQSSVVKAKEKRTARHVKTVDVSSQVHSVPGIPDADPSDVGVTHTIFNTTSGAVGIIAVVAVIVYILL